MTEEKTYNEYLGELVKAIDARSSVVFYGNLKDISPKNFILLPYIAYRANRNGIFYATWISEGKPLILSRIRISALHPIDREEAEIIIENSKREGDIDAMKRRLEEITTKLNLTDMEEAEVKRKRKE